MSGGWRVASGRLHTPVTDAAQTPNGYVPLYGAINSERLPRYDRADATVTYLMPIGGPQSAIVFASVGNAFARRNFFDYAYAPDFRERRPITSAAPRIVYFGLTITR